MLLLLALSGCAAAPEAGQAEITRIEPDGTALAYAEMLGGENIIAAEYSAPGTKSLTVEIQRHDGDGWSASARSVEFPNISDEGVLLLSFDSLAGGFGAAVLQPLLRLSGRGELKNRKLMPSIRRSARCR